MLLPRRGCCAQAAARLLQEGAPLVPAAGRGEVSARRHAASSRARAMLFCCSRWIVCTLQETIVLSLLHSLNEYTKTAKQWHHTRRLTSCLKPFATEKRHAKVKRRPFFCSLAAQHLALRALREATQLPFNTSASIKPHRSQVAPHTTQPTQRDRTEKEFAHTFASTHRPLLGAMGRAKQLATPTSCL
jgi:hypothetical protein